jgi:mRNA-degrading endonuclease RelE of RelBE toxin-antitoxin system
VKSRITSNFRRCFAELPPDTQRQTREAYRKFTENPHHPSLHLKKVHAVDPIYSVRISRDYRALGVQTADEIVWFWIGSHADYERILSST